MSKARAAAFSLTAGWGRWIAVYAIEIVTILFAGVLAFLLRFDFSIPPAFLPALGWAAAVWLVVKLAAFKTLGLDRRWARYSSISDLLRLTVSNATGTSASLIVLLLLRAGVPRTIYVIDFLLCVTITAGLRVGVRVAAELGRPHFATLQDRKQTIVYGAGSAAATLLRDLRLNPALPYDVCGVVDDDRRKADLVLYGFKVLGSGDKLPEIAAKRGAEIVLIAIPSASGPQMKAIIERCTQAGLPYKTIPSLAEIIEENGLARQIRDVAVEDLLGRVPVNLEQHRISAQLQGSVVLVTGAGGSIGSEICRQIARFHPAAIVGFEIAESPLFHLQNEIARSFPAVPFHAEIGSIQNPARLAEVFDRYCPTTVYHAAAYKHVP
ncbi:MAG: polysaccharide biosynthesis protein, partial [Acidobacteriota bacterium]|nr:polysaccharide biosynthesis protein [Acidobacteriota bacterium]